MTNWANGLQELAQQYDGFVLDQFGVLHDGQNTYPGVIDALQQLRDKHKSVIILSNSGKRAIHNSQRLLRFGIGPELYDSIISSGEMCWQMLQRRDRAPWSSLGQFVYLVNPQEDQLMLDTLPITPVEDLAHADFILLASLPDAMPPAALAPLLTTAAARKLPMICANPDRYRLTARGIEASSGTVAANYEALGGPVLYCGKPYPAIYAFCRERLAELSATSVCAVGDSLEHDVLGGSRAGFASCFITGGLHAQDFAAAANPSAELIRLLATPEAHNAPAPDWVLPHLSW